MGAPTTEHESIPRERPVHQVAIPGFLMGKFNVTFAQYDAFCKATMRESRNVPRDYGWGRGNLPVIDVSWEDAHDFCDWVNEIVGERFRLPTESEWEYACRAGTATPFSFPEPISTSKANYNSNYTYGKSKREHFLGKTLPVGSLPPNAFGLFEMHGNVWEWCQDAWNETYDQPDDLDLKRPDSGAPWLTGDKRQRVLRGGSWYNLPGSLRSAGRFRLWGTDSAMSASGSREPFYLIDLYPLTSWGSGGEAPSESAMAQVAMES